MVSPLLSIETWKLVEKQDERQTYVQYNDEKFVKSLFRVAKKIIDAPIVTTSQKKRYIDTIENINAHYFVAQDTKTAAQGQFHKYDSTAEDHFRETVAREVSRCITDLRTLLDAHATVLEEAKTRLANQSEDPQSQREAFDTFEQTIAACTLQAVCDGWFPIVELYYFSLNPGERAAEGRERQEQRVYGTEETQGMVDRLAQPELNQITQQDLERLKQVNKRGQVNGHPVIQKLQTEYDWAVSTE